MSALRWTVLFVVPLVMIGCKGPTPPTKEAIYDIKGKVVAVEKEKGKIKLDHEDIPGFMNAMTMSFKVENPAMLDEFKAGDAVVGKLKRTDGETVITELKKR